MLFKSTDSVVRIYVSYTLTQKQKPSSWIPGLQKRRCMLVVRDTMLLPTAAAAGGRAKCSTRPSSVALWRNLVTYKHE